MLGRDPVVLDELDTADNIVAKHAQVEVHVAGNLAQNLVVECGGGLKLEEVLNGAM